MTPLPYCTFSAVWAKKAVINHSKFATIDPLILWQYFLLNIPMFYDFPFFQSKQIEEVPVLVIVVYVANGNNKIALAKN